MLLVFLKTRFSLRRSDAFHQHCARIGGQHPTGGTTWPLPASALHEVAPTVRRLLHCDVRPPVSSVRPAAGFQASLPPLPQPSLEPDDPEDDLLHAPSGTHFQDKMACCRRESRIASELAQAMRARKKFVHQYLPDNPAKWKTYLFVSVRPLVIKPFSYLPVVCA